MANKGKVHLNYVIIAPADQVEEGDRIFRSHQTWMESTHHRDGDKALISYEVSKAPELENPLDTSSNPTGNTVFVLAEVYESEAGVADHFQQAQSSWQDFGALAEWLGKCRLVGTPAAPIINSLW
jgi:quinol monooxygenase YgiN